MENMGFNYAALYLQGILLLKRRREELILENNQQCLYKSTGVSDFWGLDRGKETTKAGSPVNWM